MVTAMGARKKIMHKCPNRKSWKNETMETWLWHHKNCTCSIMDLYEFKMVNQDDHIRAYWETEGKLNITWSSSYGMLLHYPKTTLPDSEIGYPYN